MTTKFDNILSLSSEEAVYYMMQDEQYYTYELPEYFNFSNVLKFVQKKIGDKPYRECIGEVAPSEMKDVNYRFNLNKDGRYAIRPLTLCNPYLYYFLVRELCGKENWDKVKDCFMKFQVPHITSCAIPVLPTRKEDFHKATTILNWWNQMEQRSLELALEYKYMFVTDITNCYGSINPQSIEDAFTMHGTKQECSENKPLAENVMLILRDMQQGFNMGIPQGSVLFDLIAEVILSYADLLLHERLVEKGIAGSVQYEILRYRDDYRIFCNDKGVLEEISYILQDVLMSLHFMMNSKKTRVSSDIVMDAVKEDKLDYIANTPVFKAKGGMDFAGFQKYLMFILMFGRKHPDCGMVRTLLSDLDKRVEKYLKPKEKKSGKHVILGGFSVNTEEVFLDDEEQDLVRYSETPVVNRRIKENIKVLASIATQIAIENNTASLYALRIISRLMTDLKEDQDSRQEIVALVRNKLKNLPNSLYLQPWIQNMTIDIDNSRGECPYDMPLCLLAAGKEVALWNNTWLRPELVKGLPYGGICDKKRVAELKEDNAPVIKLVIRNPYADMDMVVPEEVEDKIARMAESLND